MCRFLESEQAPLNSGCGGRNSRALGAIPSDDRAVGDDGLAVHVPVPLPLRGGGIYNSEDTMPKLGLAAMQANFISYQNRHHMDSLPVLE